MAEKRPLICYSGVIKELEAGDTLPGGGATVITEEGTAGETLSQYQVVYKATADSKWYKAQCDGTAAEASALGMVTEAGGIAQDATGTIAIGEQEITNAGWDWSANIGGDGYVSATAGSVTATAPTTVGQYAIPICRLLTTTKILWKPLTGWIVTADNFNTSTGHDHDGSDSKQINYVNLVGAPQEAMGGVLVAASATSLKIAFAKGNHSELFDGTNWVTVKKTSEPTAANTANDVAGVALAIDKVYDVFEYRDSDTASSLHFRKWATTAARTAAWVTSTAYKKGDALTDTNYYVCCADHTSDSAKRPNGGANSADYWLSLGAAPTQGIVPSDYYGLYWLDGRIVLGPNSTGANSWDGRKYRWLGCIYTYSNGGTVNFKDEKQYNYISNFFNKRGKTIGKDCPYSTTTTRAVPTSFEGWNGSTTEWKISFVLCETRVVDATAECEAYNSAGAANATLALTLDSTSALAAGSSVASTNVSNALSICQIAKFNGLVSPGLHYLMPLEESQISNTYFRYYYASGDGRDTRAAVSGTIEG